MFRSLVLATAVLAASLAPSVARADEAPRARVARAPVPLDGVAAVVEDVFIFRSEIAHRTKHFEAKLSRDPVKRRAELVELEKQILARLIDEVLMTRDAAKLHLEVTDAEVNAGIASVAESNKVSRKELEVEVLKVGYTLAEYQEEIRRQIIEQKWLLTRATGKIDRKKTPDASTFQAALEQQREQLLLELRSRAYIEVR